MFHISAQVWLLSWEVIDASGPGWCLIYTVEWGNLRPER